MSAVQIDSVSYHPIGVIHSPFRELEGMPIQPIGALGVTGSIEVYPEYQPGLADLAGFSHIILIYAFHRITEGQLKVKPFLDVELRGVFSTRAPKRPNPIGLSVVKLLAVEGNYLKIENVDILDGTPLLDIKPSIPDFDHFEVDRLGWYSCHQNKVQKMRADRRFKE